MAWPKIPSFKRRPAPSLPARADGSTTDFHPLAERALIAETLLASAARLMTGRRELELVRGVCEAMCEVSGHIRLAWTWFGDETTDTIRPQAYAGSASDYAAGLTIRRNLLTEMGPAFRTLGGDQPQDFHISRWSLFGPWREVAQAHGVRSVMAVPLKSSFNGMGGLFVIYADQPDYFREVGESLFMAIGELFSSVLTASAERVALEQAANHDALTGVLNRHALPILERRMVRHSLFDPKSYVLLIDVDHFKSINDTLGHARGDEVLRDIALTLRNTLRRDDSVMRWGGEEFLVCLPNTRREDALVVAEKLRLAVAGMGGSQAITVSIGISEVLADRALSATIEIADQALLQAKSSGRNCVIYRV
ncbi:MAG: GGDEF domain-containing protein [Hylemonella sp.]|uniref:GGDEF domain-containing protein n=1 Tax=Hylemonella sp. TaxID=2066020 RepID=UPI0022C1CEA4|nr:GGDEF domain-containing protein [Hylemonella sp.]MCZ8250899.1 GGDEF domain-containing protein [Hylemonella sp.]